MVRGGVVCVACVCVCVCVCVEGGVGWGGVGGWGVGGLIYSTWRGGAKVIPEIR